MCVRLLIHLHACTLITNTSSQRSPLETSNFGVSSHASFGLVAVKVTLMMCVKNEFCGLDRILGTSRQELFHSETYMYTTDAPSIKVTPTIPPFS